MRQFPFPVAAALIMSTFGSNFKVHFALSGVLYRMSKGPFPFQLLHTLRALGLN